MNINNFKEYIDKTILKEVPASNELSDTISKQLKKDGFKFVGSIQYAIPLCKQEEWLMTIQQIAISIQN